MYVIATFEQPILLELTLSALAQKGIREENLHIVPIDKRKEPGKPMRRNGGFRVLVTGILASTCLALLGGIFGYTLAGGPFIWGIIGAVSGLFATVLAMFTLRKRNYGTKKITSEVVLMIRCEEHQWETVEKILWDNTAFGESRFQNGSAK